MNDTAVLANRIFHLIILTMIVLLTIGLVDTLARPALLFVAISPLVTWVLGKYYERSMILDADLVDPDTLRDLERENARLFFRR